ncbi:MAG: hypothetical protein OXE59_08885 [Bacteroidetes bacterium]|nr:hypothetical protein [Bacteroidota bacterium]
MQLAFWNFPPTECLQVAADSLGIDSERLDASRCKDLLYQNQVDLALLPITVALNASDELDIIPGGAVSSWRYPFAQIHIHSDLYQAKTLQSSPDQVLEEFMARVILKEHYGRDVKIVTRQSADVQLLLEDSVQFDLDSNDTLDIGQEWFELSQYPMVWGVYCCLNGNGTDAMTDLLNQLTHEAEVTAHGWEASLSMPTNNFFRESLRLRLDDVAIAGITAIRDFMYYYGLTEELPPFSIFTPENRQQQPWWGQDLESDHP